MSLWNLSWRNVQRNFRLYSIYLFSMITGVIIHFTFSSLMFNTDILAALENKENFQQGVTVASVVVFLFIIFFILYANSFFMKQRKKEFGMYLLFGMSERQIALMVFFETLLLSIISLITGILIGGLLSKFSGMLLMNLMQYDNVISISFPAEAIGSTILLFIVLILIISIQSYWSIGRVQLVELFHAKEKMEHPIKFSPVLALVSIFLLALAFFLISRERGSDYWQEYSTESLMAVTVGIIFGTYLFFRQFSGWFLQTMTRRKKFHEGNKVLWTSSLRFSIRGNTLNLTFISLFSAAIILLVGFVSINYAVQFESVGRNLPNNIAFSTLDGQTNEEIETTIQESGHPIIYHETLTGITAMAISNRGIAFENPEYFSEDIFLVPESQYNSIVSLREHEQTVELAETEALALSQGMDSPRTFENGQEPEFTVSANGETSFQVIERKDYALLGWSSDPVNSMGIKKSVLVISDEIFKSLQNNVPLSSYEIYQVEDAKNAEELSEKVYAIVSQTPGAYYSAFADVYSIQIEGSALILFAASFLAIIALFALGSVIYFKQLREATEEQRQYTILRKIGIGDSEMKNVIRKQLLFVFLPPLILGILHSWFILKYYMLNSIVGYPQLTAIIWGIMGIYFLIYLLFYWSSTSIYYKIVNQIR